MSETVCVRSVDSLSRFEQLIAGFIVLACLLILGTAVGSIFADGQLYRIEQPVPVVGVTAEAATLYFKRYAAFGLAGECANELHCQFVVAYPPDRCPLEKGQGEFDYSLPLPETVRGQECVIRGTVQYKVAWVALTYLWESEPFQVPSS